MSLPTPTASPAKVKVAIIGSGNIGDRPPRNKKLTTAQRVWISNSYLIGNLNSDWVIAKKIAKLIKRA